MKKTHRIIGIICLFSFLTGCASSYNTLPLSMTDPTHQDAEAKGALLQPGDGVRITVKDGRKIKGEFVRFQDDSLVFREARYEGGDEDHLTEIHAAGVTPESKSFKIPRDDIIKLEQRPSNTAGPLFIGATVVGLMWAMITIMDKNIANEEPKSSTGSFAN